MSTLKIGKEKKPSFGETPVIICGNVKVIKRYFLLARFLITKKHSKVQIEKGKQVVKNVLMICEEKKEKYFGEFDFKNEKRLGKANFNWIDENKNEWNCDGKNEK